MHAFIDYCIKIQNIQIKKLWDIYTIQYYEVIRKNEDMKCAYKRMDMESHAE